jgi:hypothetical protein
MNVGGNVSTASSESGHSGGGACAYTVCVGIITSTVMIVATMRVAARNHLLDGKEKVPASVTKLERICGYSGVVAGFLRVEVYRRA